MSSLYTEIDIEAPRTSVWDALIHKEEWRRWNTFLFDCDPRLPFAQGRDVFLALCRLEGEDETEFQPKVLLLHPEVCLQWKTKVPGLVSEHIFELEDIGPNRTRYIHRERFSGPLSALFLPFIRRDEKQGQKRMAWQLKRYVEFGGRAPRRR